MGKVTPNPSINRDGPEPRFGLPAPSAAATTHIKR